MTGLANLGDTSILRAIARKRWNIPVRSGRLGKLLGGAPYVAKSAHSIIRASTRLSQGVWLARLAATAADRAGGRPIQVAELGTCVGVSGMYLLAGMGQRDGGHLTTFEGDAQMAELARHHFESLRREHHLTNVTFEVRVGRFEQTVASFFQDAGPVLDLVFIDGHHQEEPTLEYHRMARRRLSERGIIVHDDIAWSTGMISAWDMIKAQEDCQIIEMLLGGRPSRGVLFVGTPKAGPIAQHHFDHPVERVLRRGHSMLRRNRPPR